MSIVQLSTKGRELIRHVVQRHRGIPGTELIARILGEVGCPRECGRAIDRWQQHEVTSRVVHRTTPDRYAVQVVVEPRSIVDHVALEVLGGRTGTGTDAAHASATLAAEIGRDREGGLVEHPVGSIIVLVLDAIVGVKARTLWRVQQVVAVIVICEEGETAGGTPENLGAPAGNAVEHAVRLPAVDDPGLDLQVLRREDLDANTVEEPWRVR